MREPTDLEVNDACMSFRHDFGLMTIADANSLRLEAREWLRAWQKVEEISKPDQIEIYRAIKRSGARKHSDIANVVADMLKAEAHNGKTPND